MASAYEPKLSIDIPGAAEAWRVRMAHHAPTITFVRPSATTPVSVTGTGCALDCAHCGGHYLEHMQPIDDLKPIADGQPNGARSLLISGGCDSRGRVPVRGHLEAIASLRAGRRLNWHLGLVEADDLEGLRPLVDTISFDIVGDAATAREVYGLDVTLADYVETLRLLKGIAPVVPHITIGLHAGEIRGESEALETLAAEGVERVILIVFIPTPGTRYAACSPPALDEVADLLAYARCLLPDAGLYLGCMRPHGRYRQQIDEIAVSCGLNLIVNPTRAAEQAAQQAGLDVIWGDECCALY
jgi:lipoyl synthase